MVYLNILIGFSFIMLVFATGVSAAQSLLVRIFSLEGEAVTAALIEQLQLRWEKSDLPAKAFDQVAARLRAALSKSGGKGAGILLSVSTVNSQVLLAMLRQFGKKELPKLVDESEGKVDVGASWDRILEGMESDWDAAMAVVSASYKSNTKRYMLALSAVMVVLFNVDAVRILRLLSVDPSVRTALVTAAAAGAPAAPAPAVTGNEAPSVSAAALELTAWQKEDVAELKTTGLPLGWQAAPLWSCSDGQTAIYHKPCSGDLAVGETLEMWLMRLFGLLLGIGLVAQGAPFWYSLIEEERGLQSGAVAVLPAPQPRP